MFHSPLLKRTDPSQPSDQFWHPSQSPSRFFHPSRRLHPSRFCINLSSITKFWFLFQVLQPVAGQKKTQRDKISNRSSGQKKNRLSGQNKKKTNVTKKHSGQNKRRNSGQNDTGVCVLSCVLSCVLLCVLRVLDRPPPDPPSAGPPLRRTARFFSPFPATIFMFSLSGVFSCLSGGVSVGRDLKCACFRPHVFLSRSSFFILSVPFPFFLSPGVFFGRDRIWPNRIRPIPHVAKVNWPHLTILIWPNLAILC